MTLTKIHVVISLMGILTGVVVLIGLISGRRFNGWTAWFLASTVATSVTGFFFPFHGVTPGSLPDTFGDLSGRGDGSTWSLR